MAISPHPFIGSLTGADFTRRYAFNTNTTGTHQGETTMIRILAALAISTALTGPALAEGMASDMACKDFNMLDHDGMVAAMQAASMATEGGMMSSDDAMASEGGTMSSDGAMEGDAGSMSSDDTLAALVKTCAGHPDMMVKDAMTPMN